MDYIWNKERAIFFVLFCGLTIFTFFIIEDDLQTNIKRSRDKKPPRIGDFLQNTTGSKQGDVPATKEGCEDTRLMPSKTFPTIALTSFPGSGNTWVRHLIETSTGYATGSVYNSRILASQGFIGEKEDFRIGTTLTVKTHWRLKGTMVGAVLLVRNPYRALLSEYNRRKGGKTGHATLDDFQSEDWHRFVQNSCRKWFGLSEYFITRCGTKDDTCKSMTVVYYEQLKLHIADEMRRILSYLDVPVDEERLACTVANAEGKFHRHKSNTSLDPFTQEERTRIDGFIKGYLDLTDKWDLPKPPLSVTSYPTDLHL